MEPETANVTVSIVEWISQNMGGILVAITAVISAASAIAALTPTPKDDAFVGKLYRLVDFFALNVGKAKDKPGA